jgi:hypothetical protein
LSISATQLYLTLMEQVDARRRKLRLPMWRLDDLSGCQDGYYAKMLHANTPSGRSAGWPTLQWVIDALYPKGVGVKLIPRRKRMPSAASISSKREPATGKTKPLPRTLRLLLREHLRSIARDGGRARQRQMTKDQRRELARRAALKRWRNLRAENTPPD